MTRILSLVAGAILAVTLQSTGARADSVADLRAGLAEMRAGDWNEALRVAGARGSISRDIIVWHWLRQGFGSSGDVLVFLDRRPDWPGLAWLRRKSEPTFTGADPDRVLKFYQDTPPQTAEGALNHAVALMAKGRDGDAQADIVTAWRTMPMERDRLFRLINDTGAQGVVFVSGDRHSAGLYRRDNVASYPLYEITSSALNMSYADENNEPGPNRLGEMYAPANYGVIGIDWDAGRLSLQIRDMDGDPVREQGISLDEIGAG